MPQDDANVRLIRIFVGSPSDVSRERSIALQLIEQLNQSPHYRDYRFEAITWDHSQYSRVASVGPQQAIESHLPGPGECEMAVFVFWSRVGTPLPADDFPDWPTVERLPAPTPAQRTGSVWEFYQAMAGVEARTDGLPAVLLFQGKHKSEPDEANLIEWATQVESCRNFFAALNPDGYQVSVIPYRGDDAFRDTLRSQLDHTVAKITERIEAGATAAAPAAARASPPRVPEAYREWIRKEVAKLDNPGLDDKAGVTISLAQIYVPAVTLGGDRKNREQRDALMLAELDARSLYMPGQPGSGKTTFCRWVLGVAAEVIPLPSQHGERLPDEYREQSPATLLRRLPVLIRLRDLADTLAPDERNWSAAQFWSALGEWLDRKRWGDGTLTSALFDAHRAAGTLLLLLDGVDEVPVEGRTDDGRTTYPRKALLSGLVNALNESGFGANRVLLTSRPYGLSANDEAQLPLDRRDLSALPEPLQNGFIDQWFHLAMPLEAIETANALRTQLAGRTDLSELRANPLMLHALCVKFYDGNQLPEDIHDLYASIVSRVLHARYERDSRDIFAANRRLQVIALDMHTGEYSEQTRTQPMASISFVDVERAFTNFAQARPFDENAALDAGEKLRDLLDNSGLLFSRDQHSAEFAHLMFTYFLASERLRVNKTPLRDSLRTYGHLKAWQPTLQFRFAYEARESLQQAMEALDALSEDVAGDKLVRAPYKAALIGLCLEIAERRGALGQWAARYQDIARRALASGVESPVLGEIFRSLGVMNLDDRPGVGVDAHGVPVHWWVQVPAGRVELEKNPTLPGEGEYPVDRPFEVSRYPVTHQQFQAFLDARDGYGAETWWNDLRRGAPPSRVHHAISNYPRDSVSWYDAVAYCRWLSARLGDEVTLPNEAQWQLAAGGLDGKKYPWGADWDATAANAGGGAPSVCTAVGLWPRDTGVGGARDFAGGVGEWCALLTGDAGDGSFRPVRGADWKNSGYAMDWARCAYRDGTHPLNRYIGIGFRVCRGSPSS